MKIGWMELLVVAVVALIVIGPDKFPEYAKKFGQVLREIRKVTSELTEEIQKDVVEPLNEVAKPLKEAVEPINSAANDLKKSANDLKKSVNSIGKDEVKKTADEKAEEIKKQLIEEYHIIEEKIKLGRVYGTENLEKFLYNF